MNFFLLIIEKKISYLNSLVLKIKQTRLEEERANWAKRLAFDKSDNKIKNGRALLHKKK